MEIQKNDIHVTSHVARDLLQSAGLFTKDKFVVWEYVSNGLQYVDHGVAPMVKVTIDNKSSRILIKDNGRGMNWEGLNNFFVMHGENQDRVHGRPGRGYFGTGKSAAFGIANCLRVTTIRNNKRSKLELHRSEIEAQISGHKIPVRILEKEVDCQEVNGTLIEIEEIQIKSVNQREVINYIERHLSQWNKGVKVFVNNHLCQYHEPSVAEEFFFRPDSALVNLLGEVELIIKVAHSPLDEDLRGVAVYSNGVWHETTLAGNEKEMTQYIFGEIDVPKLDEDNSPIRPFNVSRTMRLNTENELVRSIHAFIFQNIETVRQQLVEAEKKRKSDEISRRLARQADEIARIINEDFGAFRNQIAKARAKAAGQNDEYSTQDFDKIPTIHGEEITFGTDLPGIIVIPDGNIGANGNNASNGSTPRTLSPEVEPDESGNNLASFAEESATTRKPRGGFQIQYKNMGVNEFRAKYVKSERTIYINLDHPQLVSAMSNRNVEDLVFKRLAYEVAFTEYAIALASEMADHEAYLDVFEPISDIRETINRIVKRAASLYAE